MGKVVKLESGSRKRAAGTGTGRSSRARQPRSKTALVLGGGGFTGAVYEIGALRALDLLSVNRTVNDFDVYVGTSAGALVAALTANGVTPEQMMRVVNEETPTPFRDINLDMLLRPNYREFLATGAKLPLHVLGLLRGLGRSIGSFSTVDLAIALADILPSGLYSGSGLEEYVRTLHVGDPMDPGVDVGPLISAEALDTVRRLKKSGEKPQWSFKDPERKPFPFEAPFHPAEIAHEVFQAYTTFALLSCDGRRVIDIPPGSTVTVRRGALPVRVARLREQSFTDRLVAKFDLPVEGWRGNRRG